MEQIGLKKNEILENIKVEKLVFSGQGFARLKHSNPDLDGRVIFITGGAIPGSIVNLRVLKKKKSFIETQILNVVEKSPIEIENPNNKYGSAGAWKWINIPYQEQLNIKDNQVKECFNVIKKYQSDILFLPIESSPSQDGYRNKTEFSYGKYISGLEGREEHFNVGFHKSGEFSKVIDFEGTPLIDEEQNEIFREIKRFSKTLGLPAYDQMRNEGFFRHILMRKSHFNNEMMILLSFDHKYFDKNTKLNKEEKLGLIKDFFINLASKYTIIKSIYFSYNSNKADVSIGDLELIYGEPVITEKILGLTFNISPTSFFQTNSAGAEKLYSIVIDFAGKTKLQDKLVLDLYGGTGTIGMIFAKNGAKKVISVELETSASKDGEENSKLNGLKDIDFVNKKVEDFLSDYLKSGKKADLIVLDPPRAGMHPKAVEDVLKFDAEQIIYVSCNPSTLARDLEYILQNSNYKIEKVKAMDMFPHTHHIETVVSLIK